MTGSAALLSKILALIDLLRRRIDDIVPADPAYDIFDSAADQTARLATLLPAGTFRPQPGSTLKAALPATVLNGWVTIAGVASRIDWGKSTLELGVTLAAPDKVRSAIFITGCTDFDWSGLKLRMTPEPATEGLVTGTNGVDRIYMDIDPARTPGWPGSFDTFGVYEPVNPYCLDWQYHTDEEHRSVPQPLVQRPDLGPNRWELQLTQRVVNVTGIVSKYPLTISAAAGHMLSGGETITFDGSSLGLTIDGISVLNGKSFRVRLPGNADDGDGDLSKIQLMSPLGGFTNAAAATDWISGGTGVTQPIPPAVTAGRRLALLYQKRGVSLIQMNACTRPRLDLDIESCGSTGLFLRGNVDPTISVRMKGKGLIACNGDAAIINDTRGTLTIPEWIVEGSGDTGIAVHTTSYLAKFLSGYTANTITVLGWGNPLGRDTLPWRPQVGDLYRYRDGNGMVSDVVNRLVAIDGFTLTFDQNHPAGFDPLTWRLYNDNLNCSVYVKKMRVVGSFTVAVTIFSKDLLIDNLEVIGSFGNGQRITAPASFYGNRTDGAIGRGLVRNALFRSVGYDATLYRSAALVLRRVGIQVTPPAGYQPLDELDYGHVNFQDCPLGCITLIGRDATIDSYRETNCGALRGSVGVADNSARNSLYAAYGELTIADLRGPMPSFYEDTAGFVTVNSGSGLRTAAGLTAAPGQTQIAMPKKVRTGHEHRVDIYVSGLRVDPAAYVANDTNVITLAQPMVAGESYFGVHARC